jgi:ferrous iron transport protein A
LRLSDLKPGQKAVIKGYEEEIISLKLLEMGCVPGETIQVINFAPLGDPMAIKVSGYRLSLRKSEAFNILIDPIQNDLTI